MKNQNIDNKELYDWLVEDINQIIPDGSGVGAAACQVCASKCREGDVVVAYAYRPAGSPTVRVGHVECAECWRERTEMFTLGVRELVVEGRIGRCTDAATQSSWPVLLASTLRLFSPAASKRGYPRPDVDLTRRNGVATGDARTATRPSALDDVSEVPFHLTSDADDHTLESSNPVPDSNPNQEQPDHPITDRGDRL